LKYFDYTTQSWLCIRLNKLCRAVPVQTSTVQCFSECFQTYVSWTCLVMPLDVVCLMTGTNITVSARKGLTRGAGSYLRAQLAAVANTRCSLMTMFPDTISSYWRHFLTAL